MKNVLLGTLLFASITFGEQIGDFAPMTIGSTWSYIYKYYYSTTLYGASESLSVTINLISKTIKQNDTIVCLNISEQGRSAGGGVQIPAFDNAVMLQFVDTIICSGDSIVYAKTYQCPVFPFWKKHSIGIDSLVKRISNQDTTYYFHKDSTYIDYSAEVITQRQSNYGQNVGLSSDTLKVGTFKSTYITLQNYNKETSSKNIQDKVADKNYSTYYRVFCIVNGNFQRQNEFFFSANGEKIFAEKKTGFFIGIKKVMK
jgi:hypothetical protein